MERTFSAYEQPKSSVTAEALQKSGLLSLASLQPESRQDKLARQFELLKVGAYGIAEAAQDAATKHLGETVTKVGVSIALGAGMAFLARGKGFGLIAARTVGAVSTVALAADVATNGKEVAGAFSDNWNSNANWNRNVKVVQNGVGKFAFDQMLMIGFGVAGAKLGHRFIPQVPKQVMTQLQLEPSGFSGDYLNRVRAPDGFANAMKTAHAKGNNERVARYAEPLKSALSDVKTYSQYVGDELAVAKAGGRLDEKGARRFLFGRNPKEVAKIDKLAGELKGMSGEDMNNPALWDRILANGREIENIVRGPGSRYMNSLTSLSTDARKARYFASHGEPERSAGAVRSLSKGLPEVKTYSEYAADDAAGAFLNGHAGKARRLDALIEPLKTITPETAAKPETWDGVVRSISQAEQLVRGKDWLRAGRINRLLTNAPNV